MRKTSTIAFAWALAWTGAAFAQVTPGALPTTPKQLTKPQEKDVGVTIHPSGTGFLLGWQQVPIFGGSPHVSARLFSSKGDPLKGIVNFENPNTGGGASPPRFTPVAGGKFAAVWETQLGEIHSGIFNPAVNKIAGVRKIALADQQVSNPVHEPVTLTNGRVALLVEQNSLSVPGRRLALYTLSSTSLAKLSGPVAMSAVSQNSGPYQDSTIVAGKSGGFVVYRNREKPSAILMQAFSPTGSKVGSPVTVNNTALKPFIQGTDFGFTIKAVRLSNDNIVVAWPARERFPQNNDTEIRARLFSSKGKAIGSDFRVNKVLTNDQVWPHVVALPAGQFAITFISYEAVATRFELRHFVRRYSAKGAPAGNPVQTQISVVADAVENAVARLKDGSLVDAFHDNRLGNGRIFGDDIPKSVVGASLGPDGTE